MRRFGAEHWQVLRRRLGVLGKAPTLDDLRGTPGRLHALTGSRSGQFAFDLRGPFRLVFEPNHDPLPSLADGGLDATRVTRIRILHVVDYHE